MNNLSGIQKLSLYPLASQVSDDQLGTSLVSTMLAISHGLEDTVMSQRLKGTFYAGFQRISAFLPQINRFARLAAMCGEVLVFAVPDGPVPEIPGVQFVYLEEGAPLAEEWFIVFEQAQFCGALFTRQVSANQADPGGLLFGRGRSYVGALTFDMQLVGAARRALDAAMQRSTPHGEHHPSTPKPYLAFASLFSKRLESRNREIAALYKTLQRRNQDLERMQGVLQSMLSRTAWEEVAASDRVDLQSAPLASRQVLTVLSSDIAGFTQLGDTTPPEQLIPDLNRYMDLLAGLVYQHDGDVDKFIGDGMLAFFKHPDEALLAGLHIQRAIQEFNKKQLASRRSPFSTRLGLASGSCLVTRIGSRARQEITVMGDTFNLASRLQGLCQPDEVLVDDATFQACQRPPALTTLMKVRGKADLLTVHQFLPEAFVEVEQFIKKHARPNQDDVI